MRTGSVYDTRVRLCDLKFVNLYQVLFGKQGETFDAERYNLAISSCALEHDLSVLSDGDSTEIGEKGITLSGGQKSRIGMARAVYHDADIYLLDDPIAAVDAHVGKHLFQQCIVNELLLNRSRSKTTNKKSSVILVTNAIQYLSDPHVDKIIVLDNGAVAEVGSYKELSENPNSLFSAFLSVVNESGSYHEEAHEPMSEIDHDNQSQGSLWEDLLSKLSPMKPQINEKEKSFVDPESESLVCSRPPPLSLCQVEHNTNKNDRAVSPTTETSSFTKALMTSELVEREKGHVTSEVYFAWAKAAGGVFIAFCILFSYAIDQGLSVGSKWWLTYWSKNGSGSPSSAREFLLVYAEINLGSICSMLLRVVLIHLSGLRASKTLFHELLDVVLRAPMSFFDSE